MQDVRECKKETIQKYKKKQTKMDVKRWRSDEQ